MSAQATNPFKVTTFWRFGGQPCVPTLRPSFPYWTRSIFHVICFPVPKGLSGNWGPITPSPPQTATEAGSQVCTDQLRPGERIKAQREGVRRVPRISQFPGVGAVYFGRQSQVHSGASPHHGLGVGEQSHIVHAAATGTWAPGTVLGP